MINYAIKRTTDGMIWCDPQQIWVTSLTAECEFGTPEAVATPWCELCERYRCVIILVDKGRRIT